MTFPCILLAKICKLADSSLCAVALTWCCVQGNPKFLEIVTNWQRKLGTVDVVLNTWLDVQKKWQALESIFVGSADIRVQLPEDSKRFDVVNADFQVQWVNTACKIVTCWFGTFKDASRRKILYNALPLELAQTCNRRAVSGHFITCSMMSTCSGLHAQAARLCEHKLSRSCHLLIRTFF